MKQGLRQRSSGWGIGLSLLAVVVMVGCGGGGGTTNPPPDNGNPVPSISSVAPTSAPVGSAARTLTINGSSFMSSSTVKYNAVAHAATFVSSTQLTISLTAGDQATAGTFPVVVTNPTPGGGNSNSANFAVNNPAPTITTLSPSTVVAGAAAKTLAINGTNFVNGATVTYNGVSHAATFVSATQVTIVLTAGDQATAGNFAVVVANPTPGGGASNSVNFVVTAANTVTVTLNGSASSTTSVAVGGTVSITAVVTGATAALSFTVNNVTNGNATFGTITGSASPYTYHAPAAIPGTDNPVTIEATQAVTGEHASLIVTVNPASGVPNAITVSGGEATGINLSLASTTTTLGLADVGTCDFPTPGSCSASVTGIQISRSGAATSFCGTASCKVWLLGQGLTNGAGTALASGLTVSVTHPQSGADVTIGNPVANSLSSGLTNIFVPIVVSSSAAVGNRDLVVTLGNGETQVYVGAIQIIN